MRIEPFEIKPADEKASWFRMQPRCSVKRRSHVCRMILRADFGHWESPKWQFGPKKACSSVFFILDGIARSSIRDDEPLLPKRVVAPWCRPEEAGDSNKTRKSVERIGFVCARADGPVRRNCICVFLSLQLTLSTTQQLCPNDESLLFNQLSERICDPIGPPIKCS